LQVQEVVLRFFAKTTRTEARLHILHVTPYYAPSYAFGGVVRAVEGMAQALIQRGQAVSVLTTDALDFNGGRVTPLEEVLDGVRVVRARNALPMLRRWANASSVLNWRALAVPLLQACDVVHLHEFRTQEAVSLVPLTQQISKPVLVSPHGTLAQHTGRSLLKRAWDSLLSPRVARAVTGVIALTTEEAQDAQALWERVAPAVRPTLHIIPNGVDVNAYANLPDPRPFREQWGLGNARVVLYMGRLHPRKGADKLARAFMQANVDNTRLLIVGGDEGLGATLAQLAQADPRIVLTGYLQGEARLQALACASLFALPAVGEGLSLAVLEAMAAGVAVLLSPYCGVTGAEAQGAGRIVPLEGEAWARALRDLLTHADLAQMGAQAQAWARRDYAWDTVGQALEAVYAGVLMGGVVPHAPYNGTQSP
jgi:glycosyltransferase involved in cell wall biosynthesis